MFYCPDGCWFTSFGFSPVYRPGVSQMFYSKQSECVKKLYLVKALIVLNTETEIWIYTPVSAHTNTNTHLYDIVDEGVAVLVPVHFECVFQWKLVTAQLQCDLKTVTAQIVKVLHAWGRKKKKGHVIWVLSEFFFLSVFSCFFNDCCFTVRLLVLWK